MKKNVAWVRDHIFSFLLQSNLAIFGGNDTVILRFAVIKENANTFLSRAISFQCYFFVTFIVFNKKIVYRVKPR